MADTTAEKCFDRFVNDRFSTFTLLLVSIALFLLLSSFLQACSNSPMTSTFFGDEPVPKRCRLETAISTVRPAMKTSTRHGCQVQSDLLTPVKRTTTGAASSRQLKSPPKSPQAIMKLAQAFASRFQMTGRMVPLAFVEGVPRQWFER